MSAVQEIVPENTLIDVPVIGDNDLCHISKSDDPTEGAICGAHPEQTWCCDPADGHPDCGRPSCAECIDLYQRVELPRVIKNPKSD